MRKDNYFQALLFFILLLLVLNAKFWGDQLHDHFSFWAASKSFLALKNPYNLEAVVAHVNSCCFETFPNTIERVWGLPVIFILISWFGFFSFQNYLIIHSLVSAFLITFSFLIISKVYNFNAKNNFIFSTLILITFLPAYEALIVGPAIMYVLIGISIFLLLVNKSPKKSLSNNFIGGLFLSLTVIKPHFLFLIPIFIFTLSVIRKEILTLFGMLAGGLILFLAMFFYHPELINYYLAIVSEFPVNLYKTPTIISYFQNYFKFNGSFRFLPALIISIISFLYIYKNKEKFKSTNNDDDLFSYALILSSIFAPYLWVYDYLPLLIPVVLITSRIRKKIHYMFLILAQILMWLVAIPMHYSVWYPFLLLFLFIFSLRRGRQVYMNK